MEDFLLIALNGLPAGKTEICGRLRKEFFAGYGNTEILDADIEVSADVEKIGGSIELDIRLKGNLTVPCDRCLEDLTLPVDRTVLLEVKAGSEDKADADEGERETLFLPQDSAELDLSQVVYDYACLSLPLQRHHPDGECDKDAVRHIRSAESDDSSVQSPAGSPFAALAGLFDNK